MSFDWDDYLTIAKDFETKSNGLPQSNMKEAMQRVALSRAYYSMYHLAVEYAKTHFGYIPRRNGSNQFHADVRIEYQKQSGNADHQEIKKILIRMHKARIDSDYTPTSLGNAQALLRSIILDADKVKTILR
jgi:hypothetical protein